MYGAVDYETDDEYHSYDDSYNDSYDEGSDDAYDVGRLKAVCEWGCQYAIRNTQYAIRNTQTTSKWTA